MSCNRCAFFPSRHFGSIIPEYSFYFPNFVVSMSISVLKNVFIIVNNSVILFKVIVHNSILGFEYCIYLNGPLKISFFMLKGYRFQISLNNNNNNNCRKFPHARRIFRNEDKSGCAIVRNM